MSAASVRARVHARAKGDAAREGGCCRESSRCTTGEPPDCLSIARPHAYSPLSIVVTIHPPELLLAKPDSNRSGSGSGTLAPGGVNGDGSAGAAAAAGTGLGTLAVDDKRKAEEVSRKGCDSPNLHVIFFLSLSRLSPPPFLCLPDLSRSDRCLLGESASGDVCFIYIVEHGETELSPTGFSSGVPSLGLWLRWCSRGTMAQPCRGAAPPCQYLHGECCCSSSWTREVGLLILSRNRCRYRGMQAHRRWHTHTHTLSSAEADVYSLVARLPRPVLPKDAHRERLLLTRTT